MSKQPALLSVTVTLYVPAGKFEKVTGGANAPALCVPLAVTGPVICTL